jgi:hypothetical protein
MAEPDLERGLREWKELMDFGWRFRLEVFPQTFPGEDPLAKLREIWRRLGQEHAAANVRMLEALGRARGPSNRRCSACGDHLCASHSKYL